MYKKRLVDILDSFTGTAAGAKLTPDEKLNMFKEFIIGMDKLLLASGIEPIAGIDWGALPKGQRY